MPQMAISNIKSRSKSPLKPKLFIDKILGFNPFNPFFPNKFYIKRFKPFNKSDFEIAHTKEYVNGFFKGNKKDLQYLQLKWSKEFAESIKYTNSSLYHAIKTSLNTKFAISPSSGFHHATPNYGENFCAFSGQVISSVKLYRESKLSGAYIDLDAHYGNSIEDSYKFVPDLKYAIQKGMNINPTGLTKKSYFKSLEAKLKIVQAKLKKKEIHYVVLCHGADTIIGDNLGAGILTKEEWIDAAKLVKKYVGNYPLTYCLFGGYRKNLSEVINSHIDAISCILY